MHVRLPILVALPRIAARTLVGTLEPTIHRTIVLEPDCRALPGSAADAPRFPRLTAGNQERALLERGVDRRLRQRRRAGTRLTVGMLTPNGLPSRGGIRPRPLISSLELATYD